jgi:opacity protein-like surface antigen
MNVMSFVFIGAIATSMSVASAADLPRRTVPVPPTPAFVQNHSGFFGGVAGGWVTGDEVVGSATVGYRFNEFLRLEGNFTNRFGSNNGQSVTVDGSIGVPVGRVTPYVFGGVGYGFNSFGKPDGDAAALWSAGGGVRFALTPQWELDGRYRHTRHFSSHDGVRLDNNTVTVGVNYKF